MINSEIIRGLTASIPGYFVPLLFSDTLFKRSQPARLNAVQEFHLADHHLKTLEFIGEITLRADANIIPCSMNEPQDCSECRSTSHVMRACVEAKGTHRHAKTIFIDDLQRNPHN